MTALQWKPVFFPPANLTVRYGASVLTAEDPAPWCHDQAARLLGPQAAPKQVVRLATCLEEYAQYFRIKSRSLPTYAALFFYPDFTHIPPRAEMQAFLIGEDPVLGPMTPAGARETFGPDERSFGEAEMTETIVPTGPALRVHRYRKLEPDKRRTLIVEEIDWVICPPNSTQAIMMITTWNDPTFSKAGITIADNMANNFRIKPTE